MKYTLYTLSAFSKTMAHVVKKTKSKASLNKINTCKELVKVVTKKVIREPKTDGYYLDLCQNNLSAFPDCYLDNQRLVLLYLEGNEITVLPEEIFICFPNLRWLDIRNNLIEEIPSSVKFHSCLETFLMQNNKIKILPAELGTLSNLKNIQTMPNPLSYPPQDIINEGTSAIIDFLHEDYKNSHPQYLKYVVKLELIKSMEEELNKPIPMPEPSNTDLINKQLQNLKFCVPFEKNKSEYLKRLNEVSFDVCSPLEVQKYVNPYKERSSNYDTRINLPNVGNGNSAEGVIERGRLNLPLKKAPFVGKGFSNRRRLKLDVILQKLLNSLNEARLKDKLNVMEDVLEIRKNIANQQKFKYEYRYKSRISHLKKGYVKTEKPYGTYKEYEHMVSKRDLRQMKENPKKYRCVRRRLPRNKIDISGQISDLLKSLEKVTLNSGESESTGDRVLEKQKLSADIAKISEIRKALKKLHLQNSNEI